MLENALLGQSHRSQAGKARLAEAIERTKLLLEMPDDYRLGIVPGSDTGAFEMAMWSLLGPRAVDVLVWESFSAGWAADVTRQLPLDDVRVLNAEYGELPDLTKVAFDRDVVFVWNGTTSGVKLPDGEWIDNNRAGLTLCDATSAAFAMELPWDRLDVVTFSWQKCLGGEAAHGMLALGPRAVERLENYTPAWPMPKVFRLTKNGKLMEPIFAGETINTPSMLCVEDWLDALAWADSIGGLKELIRRSERNSGAIARWVETTGNFEFLARESATRSNTSVCLTITAPWFVALSPDEQRKRVNMMAARLAEENVALDIAGYRDAPPGIRIWAGPTVERDDITALLPWLDWALAQVA
ncbi:MAG: phosphoserine transaminase [Candidatus Zixiibacteriota bacterium]